LDGEKEALQRGLVEFHVVTVDEGRAILGALLIVVDLAADCAQCLFYDTVPIQVQHVRAGNLQSERFMVSNLQFGDVF
jgi:hypothetical protein